MTAKLKTGQYAATSARTISWFSQPVRSKDGKTQKLRKKDVKNPIFNKLAEMTDDEFWKNLFGDCAYGKFPKGFDYNGGELIFRRGVREPVAAKLEEVLPQVKRFFNLYAGIKSPRDLEIEKIAEERYRQESMTIHEIQWKDIRSMKMQEMLIMRFIAKLVPNRTERNALYDRIKNAFALGTLINKDVVFENGEIQTINGIFKNSIDGKYYVDPRREPKRTKISAEDPKKLLDHCYLDQWLKYNKTLMASVGKKK